jgi:hypothetical protein
MTATDARAMSSPSPSISEDPENDRAPRVVLGAAGTEMAPNANVVGSLMRLRGHFHQ